jgi:hypothetical protein
LKWCEKGAFPLKKGLSQNINNKGESAMKLEVSVPELVEVFKEIQKQPEQIFEMIRLDVREIVGDYMTAMMNAELTHFLGREPYKPVFLKGSLVLVKLTPGYPMVPKGL